MDADVTRVLLRLPRLDLWCEDAVLALLAIWHLEWCEEGEAGEQAAFTPHSLQPAGLTSSQVTAVPAEIIR